MSVNLKEIGKFPQVQSGIFKSTWNAPNSLLVGGPKKINNPDIEVPELAMHRKAKSTDLLSTSFIDFKLTISDRLKKLIEAKNYDGIQFFPTILYKGDGTQEKYWILHPFGFRNDYINFSSSTIKCVQGIETSYMKVENMAQFNLLTENQIKERKMHIIDTVSLYEAKIKEDFFLLEWVSGGIGYYVSEALKNEIEKAGCTGMQFIEV